MVNFILAGTLALIAAYTDYKERMIYNKHVFVFIVLAAMSDVIQKRYNLLVSGLIIFAFYLFIYFAGQFISRLAQSIGGIGLPKGETAMGGGDVKLSFALALLLGHVPVLIGTIMAAFMMIIGAGISAWRTTGSPMAIAYTATGKLPGTPMAFGMLLGPCTVVISLLF